MTAEDVKKAIRNVPDFPIKGIQFKDITTALAKPECLKWMRDEIVSRYKGLGITKIVGIESRGFIVAPAVAIELGIGFVPIRKPNKLPAETVSVTYAKEYGEDTIQMHNLVKKLGVKKIYVNCIIELEGLHGREYLEGKAENVDCLFGIEVDE